ncbi:MAG: hypothetical protein ACLFS9_00495 [Nitriliruptoraceae bacterium]
MEQAARQPDLVAFHHDGRAARATITRLSRAGVDGGDIVLLGRVEVVTAGRYGDRQTDRGASLALGAHVLKGMLMGLLPGAAFGALLLGVTAGWTLTPVLAGAGGGGFFGLAVGAVGGLLVAPTMATSWERTFSPLVPGGVVIGVRCDDARSLRRALRVLRVSGAHDVRQVGDLDDLPDGPLDPDDLDPPAPMGGLG